MNKLNVVQPDTSETVQPYTFRPKTFREQTQARFEREWHVNPTQFNPNRNVKEQERIRRTLNFLNKQMSMDGISVADLGCGMGNLTKAIRDQGAFVDAVDVAKQPLDHLKNEDKLRTFRSCVPNTLLEDSGYDLVVSTELIGDISVREHRLFFNELARLVKRDGKILFSTAVDIYSEDALQTLFGLMQTELEILDFQPSYHSRFIRLKNLFAMPKRFASASLSVEQRKVELDQRHSISAFWFKWNSTPVAGKFWKWCAPFFSRIEKRIGQSLFLLKALEKISHSESSISHLIVFARRKPLIPDAGDE